MGIARRNGDHTGQPRYLHGEHTQRKCAVAELAVGVEAPRPDRAVGFEGQAEGGARLNSRHPSEACDLHR